MKSTSFILGGEVEKKLNKLCAATGANKSAVIRKLIEDFDSDMSASERKKMKVLEEVALQFKAELAEQKAEREYIRRILVVILGGKALELANFAKKTEPKFSEWLLK